VRSISAADEFDQLTALAFRHACGVPKLCSRHWQADLQGEPGLASDTLAMGYVSAMGRMTPKN